LIVIEIHLLSVRHRCVVGLKFVEAIDLKSLGGKVGLLVGVAQDFGEVVDVG
jgi:hypothetical protein